MANIGMIRIGMKTSTNDKHNKDSLNGCPFIMPETIKHTYHLD